METTLQEKTFSSDIRGYHVTMKEGVFFQVKSNSLELLSTHGLAGCVAIAIYLKYRKKSYIFLTHIQADLLTKTDKTVEQVKDEIKDLIRTENHLQDFDFDLNSKYNLKICIIATGGFDNPKSLAYNIKNAIPSASYSKSSAVAFLINHQRKKIYLIKPITLKFKFFDNRYKGFGTPISKWSNPYDEKPKNLHEIIRLYFENEDRLYRIDPSLYKIIKLFYEDPELLQQTEKEWYEILNNID
jgi:hypothetical protein